MLLESQYLMKYPISGKHVNGGIVPQLNTHPASHGSMAGRHSEFLWFYFYFWDGAAWSAPHGGAWCWVELGWDGLSWLSRLMAGHDQLMTGCGELMVACDWLKTTCDCHAPPCGWPWQHMGWIMCNHTTIISHAHHTLSYPIIPQVTLLCKSCNFTTCNFTTCKWCKFTQRCV